MRFLYLFSLLASFAIAKNSFITKMEYSSSLYKNPRGIGCNECHGERGEGKIVATYIEKKKKKSFAPPSINSMDFKDFYIAMNKRKRGMPRYFLTDSEIKALYFYLKKVKKGEK